MESSFLPHTCNGCEGGLLHEADEFGRANAQNDAISLRYEIKNEIVAAMNLPEKFSAGSLETRDIDEFISCTLAEHQHGDDIQAQRLDLFELPHGHIIDGDFDGFTQPAVHSPIRSSQECSPGLVQFTVTLAAAEKENEHEESG